jgi:hypothetical protein
MHNYIFSFAPKEIIKAGTSENGPAIISLQQVLAEFILAAYFHFSEFLQCHWITIKYHRIGHQVTLQLRNRIIQTYGLNDSTSCHLSTHFS